MMNTKLQELTDKIYSEGVEKGQAEAKLIIEAAQQEAHSILTKAKSEAALIISQAEARADELSRNTKSELKLFARQAVDALKMEITQLINGTIVSDSVKAATADAAFMQRAILLIVQEWAKNQEVVIEAKDAQSLIAYFESQAKALLQKGVTITQANAIKADFAIIPQKEGYKITFGDEELMAYFKAFLRPKLIEMLFT